MNPAFDKMYYNNTLADYLIALGIILVGSLLLQLFKRILLKQFIRWSRSTEGTTDDVIVDSIERFGVAALQFGIIYWGINYLEISEKAQKVVHIATSFIVTYFVLRLVSTIILLLLQTRIRKQEGGENKIKQLGGLMLLINIIIWVTGIVFLLDNLGQKVTTIITGLGIGGIAIALAAQNILGDLFNYFVIFFDRPFEAGDFITVDDKMGTVEYVGIKTTRIRGIGGEQIVIGNANLTGARIHNYKRLVNRRVVFHLNIDYRTPPEKLKIIPSLIREVIEKQPRVMFDRAHFSAFGDWSLKFEVVYFFMDPGYNKFMDVQQAINISVYETLIKNEIYLVTGGHISFMPQPE